MTHTRRKARESRREPAHRYDVELPDGVTTADWGLERVRVQNPSIRSYLGCIRLLEEVLDSNYAILNCSPERLLKIWRQVEQVGTPEERLRNPRLARLEFTADGYPAAMSDPATPAVARAIEVIREATGGEVRIPPLMGGSLPIAPIGDVLGTPFVIAPIVNADNNQHAPNENLRMREFRRGVALYAALLAEAGHGW